MQAPSIDSEWLRFSAHFPDSYTYQQRLRSHAAFVAGFGAALASIRAITSLPSDAATTIVNGWIEEASSFAEGGGGKQAAH